MAMVTYKEPLDHYLNRLIAAVEHVGNEVTRIGNLMQDLHTMHEDAVDTQAALWAVAEQLEHMNDLTEAGKE